jgi:hypothetical protein
MNTNSIIEKIRALLAKTVDAGCTEAEAMMAAAKAAAMMDKYELNPEAVTAGQDKATTEHYKRTDHTHPVTYAARGVGLFTGTKIYRDTRATVETVSDLFGNTASTTQPGKWMRILGLAHEVEIAGYLLDICVNALSCSAAKALVAENEKRTRGREPILVGGERAKWVNSFQIGMAARMGETLTEMARERAVDTNRQINAGAGNGTSLQVVRQNLIGDWLREHGVNLSGGRSANVGNKSAHAAGREAGGGVRFHTGMGSGGGQRAIGGR